MSERLRGNPEPRGIKARIRRKLTEGKGEVVGGVVAGSATFIYLHQSLVAGGVSPDQAAVITSGYAAGAAAAGDMLIHEGKRALRKRRKK